MIPGPHDRGQYMYLWSAGAWMGICGTFEQARGRADEHRGGGEALIEAAKRLGHDGLGYNRTGITWSPSGWPVRWRENPRAGLGQAS